MQNLAFYDLKPRVSDFQDEVIAGLGKPQKTLIPTLFYDQQGSALFEQITQLEEYYLTRTEIMLLQTYGAEIASLIGEHCLLIEYGSGSSYKIRILLDSLVKPAAYMPIDVSREHMQQASQDLAKDYPDLDIEAVCADYTQQLLLPIYEKKCVGKKVIFFPGSTIGNLDNDQILWLLRQSAEIVGSSGGLLLGVDTKKDPKILHAAYNDAQEITAVFNLNILVRINRELGANFDIKTFSHYAFYDPKYSRIEMHLISLKDQKIMVADQIFDFRKGESIHTENSYKFTIEDIQRLAEQAGFDLKQSWTDQNQLFNLCYLSVV